MSRIHGEISAEICASLWPQIDPHENPMDYITNGVHVLTFLSELWRDNFDRRLGPGWVQRLTDTSTWQGIDSIPTMSSGAPANRSSPRCCTWCVTA